MTFAGAVMASPFAMLQSWKFNGSWCGGSSCGNKRCRSGEIV